MLGENYRVTGVLIALAETRYFLRASLFQYRFCPVINGLLNDSAEIMFYLHIYINFQFSIVDSEFFKSGFIEDLYETDSRIIVTIYL